MQSTNHRRKINAEPIQWGLLLIALIQSPTLFGQEPVSAKKSAVAPALNSIIEISDEPKTVDPATLVVPQLAARITVKFDGEPIKNVFNWIQRTTEMNVLVDYKALANAKLLDTEPVFEELKDVPLYLLLSRLEALGLGWYMQDNTLQITSREEYLKHEKTVSYNLGDLFDAGYLPADLVQTITKCSGGQWEGDGGNTEGGTAILLGDVVFIRQTEGTHREIAGLLAAIRKHGRRTLTLDTPLHDVLRTAVGQNVTVDFQETPLVVAVQELAKQAKINIRLDRPALARASVRERTPVTLKLADQKLGAVLRSLLSTLNLTWYLRDDVLWITNAFGANQYKKSCVFDVRDLCRDRDESLALKETLQKQARAKWRPGSDAGGELEIPKPGVLVCRHTEATLDEILQLLENYRGAFRQSKLRVSAELDPAEVIIGYYRLPRPMADDLKLLLPKLILPNTWQSPAHPDAVGSILEIAVDAKGGFTQNPPNRSEAIVIASENMVLVIRQSRAAHQSIGKLIQSLMKSQPVDLNATFETNKKTLNQPTGFGRGLIPATAK